jgi:uncharacterized membrane protein YciS (DUF1049 family)
MDYILGLLGVIGALIVAFFFQRSKAQTAEALNQNIKVKEDLLKAETKIGENNAELKLEEIKRNQLLEDVKKEQDEEVNSGDVLDFFNNRK